MVYNKSRDKLVDKIKPDDLTKKFVTLCEEFRSQLGSKMRKVTDTPEAPNFFIFLMGFVTSSPDLDWHCASCVAQFLHRQYSQIYLDLDLKLPTSGHFDLTQALDIQVHSHFRPEFAV
jgi:hypothetical protein